MRPEITYKLEVKLIKRTQEFWLDLKENLHELGIFSYSEGFLDDLEKIEDSECEKRREEMLDESYTPELIIIHGYDKETLLIYQKELKNKFGNKIEETFSQITTASWLENWKDSFKPIETKSYLVCPPWDKKENQNKKQIIIEPALAFGTGQHETTQICLNLIEDYIKEAKNPKELEILDLGTGSGILAIAAAKEGVIKIDALDIEEDSVNATKTNSEINKVSFEVFKSDLTSYMKGKENKKYDLIIANILLPVLLKTIPDMASSTKKGAELILSGLITEQKEEMLEACSNYGFKLCQERGQGDWIGLRVKKI